MMEEKFSIMLFVEKQAEEVQTWLKDQVNRTWLVFPYMSESGRTVYKVTIPDGTKREVLKDSVEIAAKFNLPRIAVEILWENHAVFFKLENGAYCFYYLHALDALDNRLFVEAK